MRLGGRLNVLQWISPAGLTDANVARFVGGNAVFQKSEFGAGQGGATAAFWLSEALTLPTAAPATPDAGADDRSDWRTRLKHWAEDVDLVPDLGHRIGSRTWFRGLATCIGLCATAISLAPRFQPLPGIAPPRLSGAQFDEARTIGIAPLALGADTGRHMGPSDVVVPLKDTPERPRIELSAAIGSGDSFARTLSRAGVSESDATQVRDLVRSATDLGAIRPGTHVDIVLGRRATRDVPRPLDHIAFRAKLDLALDISRINGALTLKQIPIRVDSTPLRIRGTVGDSLYRSARAAGAPPKAIQAYLQLLATRLSVADDIDANDMFDIVVGYRRAETGEAEVGDLLYGGLERPRGRSLHLLKWESEGRSQWFEASGVGQTRGALAQPVYGGRITSTFGMRRHPILGYTRMHAGLDIAAPYGSPIYAVTDGTVSYAGWHGGHGKYVRIEHGGGIGSGYGHMSQIVARPGQHVRRGQVIGYVGSTGLSTGPHLHYELYRGGQIVNPQSIKFTTTAQLSGRDLAAFHARLSELRRLRVGLPSAPAKKPEAASGQQIALLPGAGDIVSR